MISWCQPKFNILSFNLNQVDLKHEMLLIRDVGYKGFIIFVKYFSCAQVNQIMNKCLNG